MTSRHGADVQPAETSGTYFDALTRLPNRTLFHDRVEQAVAQAQRSGEQLAVHYLELDHLDSLVETYGERVGEELIKGVAGRVGRFIRKSDTLARLEGGEFAIIQRAVGNTMGVTALVQKVLDALAQPFAAYGHQLRTSASVGISLFTPGAKADEIMTQAEKALHMAKGGSHQSFRFHDAEVDEELQSLVALWEDLSRALERQEFFLEYQAQVDLADDQIFATEALVRWHHPKRGVVDPAGFIPLAEDVGLIVPLGQWVLEEACRQRQAWCEQGLREVPVAVNVSGVQFRDTGFPERILSTLEETGLNPELLDLEFTESVLLHNSEELRKSLRRLHDQGVKFSIDDFGTGHSSLGYLRAFPVQKLKIAGEFIRDVASNQDAASIVNAVIGLGHNLDLQVVAEGVETEEQLAYLRENGCDGAQGFVYGRPEGARSFAEYLT